MPEGVSASVTDSRKKTESCMQARLNSPRAFKLAVEMLGKNEKILMYVG